MARSKPPGNVWLQTDVPRDIADRFTVAARSQYRSNRGQLRILIDRFIAEHEADADKAPAASRAA